MAQLLKAPSRNDFWRGFEAWNVHMRQRVAFDGHYFEADNM